jgi:hypothetical protein
VQEHGARSRPTTRTPSPACINSGCKSSRHAARASRADRGQPAPVHVRREYGRPQSKYDGTGSRPSR